MKEYISQRNKRRAKRKGLKQQSMFTPKFDTDKSQPSRTRHLNFCAIDKRQSIGSINGKVQPAEFASFRHDFRSHYPSPITEKYILMKNDFNVPVPVLVSPYVSGQLAQSLGEFWPHRVCRRYWSLGYQADPILEIFHQLPAALRDAIGEALDAMQQYEDAHRRHAPCAEAAVEAESCIREGAWEHDAVHAFVRVDFDPATQERF